MLLLLGAFIFSRISSADRHILLVPRESVDCWQLGPLLRRRADVDIVYARDTQGSWFARDGGSSSDRTNFR